MINHIRTLLMNVDGSSIPYDIPGEELLPHNFRAIQLTIPLLNARRIIFGADPDRHMLNYRLRQIMTMLHATDLYTHVVQPDPRITYSVTRDDFSSNLIFSRRTAKMGTATRQLAVLGEHDPPDSSGRMSNAWLVRIDDADTVTTLLMSPNQSLTQDIVMTNGQSNDISLPGTNMKVRVPETTAGAQWRLTVLSRPVLGLGDLLSKLSDLPERDVVAIFQQGTSAGVEEPFVSLYQLWSKHHELAYRLGAFTLAMAFSTDRLR